MAEKLELIKREPAVVADWWGFLGGGAMHLAQRYPKAQRVVVEPSEALRARSLEQGRQPWWSPRRWRSSAAAVRLDAIQPGSAQLLWANMMLHWVDDVPSLFAEWQRSLAVDGFVMFSTFGPDTLKELRALYARLGWPQPAQAFVDMHDIGDQLVRAGFADPVMDMEQLTLSWPEPRALLAELRGMGSNLSAARGTGLRTPRWRARLEQELLSLAGVDGRLSLSFEIVYGHAFKPAPRPRVEGETKVSLEDMRSMVRSRRGGGEGG